MQLGIANSSSAVHVRLAWPGSPYHLALLRILISAQVLYGSNSKVFDLLLAIGKQQNVRTIFPAWLDHFIASDMVTGLQVACSILAVLGIVGLFSRVVFPFLSVTFILLFSFYYLGVNAPINWLYFWFPLVILSFSKCADVWSLDSLLKPVAPAQGKDLVPYRWPVELMVVWFCYIYFAAGLAKLFPLYKGITWFNGQTSKEIICFRYADSPFHYFFGKPFFDYSDATLFFSFITICAVLLELSTIALLFTERFHLWLLGALLAMHVFLYCVGVGGFTQAAAVLGVALLPTRWFERFSLKKA